MYSKRFIASKKLTSKKNANGTKSLQQILELIWHPEFSIAELHPYLNLFKIPNILLLSG